MFFSLVQILAGFINSGKCYWLIIPVFNYSIDKYLGKKEKLESKDLLKSSLDLKTKFFYIKQWLNLLEWVTEFIFGRP